MQDYAKKPPSRALIKRRRARQVMIWSAWSVIVLSLLMVYLQSKPVMVSASILPKPAVPLAMVRHHSVAAVAASDAGMRNDYSRPLSNQ